MNRVLSLSLGAFLVVAVGCGGVSKTEKKVVDPTPTVTPTVVPTAPTVTLKEAYSVGALKTSEAMQFALNAERSAAVYVAATVSDKEFGIAGANFRMFKPKNAKLEGLKWEGIKQAMYVDGTANDDFLETFANGVDLTLQQGEGNAAKAELIPDAKDAASKALVGKSDPALAKEKEKPLVAILSAENPKADFFSTVQIVLPVGVVTDAKAKDGVEAIVINKDKLEESTAFSISDSPKDEKRTAECFIDATIVVGEKSYRLSIMGMEIGKPYALKDQAEAVAALPNGKSKSVNVVCRAWSMMELGAKKVPLAATVETSHAVATSIEITGGEKKEEKKKDEGKK